MSSPAGKTALVFDRVDAERFLSDTPRIETVLALTPDARAALRDSSIPVIGSEDIYTPHRHRRVLARVRCAKPAFAESVRSSEISDAAQETVLGLFDLIASMAGRAQETLQEGPWVLPTRAGWVTATTRDEALHALLARLKDVPWWDSPEHCFGQAIVEALNRFLAAQIRKKQPVVLTNSDRGFVAIPGELRKAEDGIIAVSFIPPTGTVRDIAFSIQAIWEWICGKESVRLISPIAPERPATRTKINKIIDAIPDPVIRKGLDQFRDVLISSTIMSERMANGLSQLLPRMNVRGVTGYSFRWRIDAALGDAAKRHRIATHLMSHGSHSLPETASAAAAVNEHARGLLVSPFADTAWPQSPHAEALANTLMPALKRKKIQPTVWGHRVADSKRTDGFRILQAGTPKAWRDHRPWMYETSDEFVAGLATLIDAMAKTDTGTNLVIRVRPQPECSLEALDALLPDADNVTVKSSGDFLDDLAAADLLISYSSTTIEEALRARKPVLLWGGGCPYHHLPARTDLPSGKDRGAVYAVEDQDALGPMIKAIANAHRDTPLSDAEIQDHVWPENVPGRELLIDTMLKGAA